MAWRTGHRPGTTPQQWAFARVNSFLTGGGARKADADLWSKASARKRSKKEEISETIEDELGEKYNLYHSTFSGAMQHAYDYAKKKLGVTVDKREIDSKVATGKETI